MAKKERLINTKLLLVEQNKLIDYLDNRKLNTIETLLILHLCIEQINHNSVHYCLEKKDFETEHKIHNPITG